MFLDFESYINESVNSKYTVAFTVPYDNINISTWENVYKNTLNKAEKIDTFEGRTFILKTKDLTSAQKKVKSLYKKFEKYQNIDNKMMAYGLVILDPNMNVVYDKSTIGSLAIDKIKK